MNASHKVVYTVFSLVLLLGSATFQKQVRSEGVGESSDQATEPAGGKMEEAKHAVGKKTKQVEEYVDDAAITAKIKAGILKDPALKVLEIGVTTTNGVVELSGVVGSQKNIDKAKKIARKVKGVKSVESTLVIRPPQ